MKKKFLFWTVLLVAIVCLLAVSVSAEGIKKFETDEFQSGDNITYIDGIDLGAYYNSSNRGASIDTLYDSSYVARTVVKNSDGTYTTYPTYYFIRLQDDWQGDYQFVICNRINDMSDVTGEEYTTNSIVRIEFPEYNPSHTFGKMSPNVEKLNSFASLKYVYVASHFTVLNSSFDRCSALETVEFAPNSKISSVNQFAFRGTSAIEEIRFPNTLKTLNKESIQGASALKVLNLGAEITTLKETNSLNGISSNDITIYLSRTIGAYNASYFPSKALVMFTGDKEQAEAFGFETTYSYSEWLEAGSPTGKMMVYGYNHCDAFYDGEHDLSGTGNCEDGLKCSRCDYKESALEHKIVKTIEYPNGYTAIGTYIYECVNADCTVVDKAPETMPAIFSALEENGFSTNGTGISFGGYTVDTDALDKFNELSDTDLTFGIAIMNPKYIGDTFFDGSSVNAQKGFIVADMSDSEYSNIKVMIDGFTGEAVNLELVITLYAYTDASDIDFIQSADTKSACSSVAKNDATLYTVSVASVDAKTGTSLDALPPFGKENA